jgi:hypothetical protein
MANLHLHNIIKIIQQQTERQGQGAKHVILLSTRHGKAEKECLYRMPESTQHTNIQRMHLFAFSLAFFCTGYKFGLGDYSACAHKHKSPPDW